MILEGGISKNYTQNWDKNGNIYYTDENGQVVDFKVNPFVKLANKVKATATNIGDWINETDPNSEAYKQKVSAIAGLETLPLGLGRFATQQIAKGLTPYVGRKIAQNMAQGIGSGVAGGGIAGGLEAGLNDRNIAIGGLQGATVGGLLGGLGGYGLGKVAQKFERAKLPNNTVAQEQYFNDYVADLNNKTKAMADFRAGKLGVKNGKMQLAYDTPMTETDAFKNWFGNSKVVDENGNPLVVYHGTNADFDTFDNSVNQNKHRQVGADLGYFFTDNEKVARRFIPKKEVQENIVNYEPFANKEEYDDFSKNIMNNWQELKQNYGDDKFFELRDAYSEIANNIYKQKNQDPQAYGLKEVYLNMQNPRYANGEIIGVGADREAFLLQAKANGYDGAIINNADTGAGIANEYVVFEPTQIKSVNNQGTFDPTNPNIYKSILAPIGTGALAERLLNKEYNERNSY